MKNLGKFVIAACSFPLYVFAWTAGQVAFYLPWSVKRVFAQGIAIVWRNVFRFRVHVILKNLVHVFPRESQESMEHYRLRLEKLARRNLEHYVLMLFEILERFHWSVRVVERRVKLNGVDRMERLRGYPLLVMGAHLSNWELLTLIGCLLNFPVAILTKFLRNPYLDALWVKSRTRYGLELIPERHSASMVARALKKNKCVGLIADQFTGDPHGIVSSFLGKPAWSPKALAVFCLKMKIPVLGAKLLRTSSGDFELWIEGPYDFHALPGFDGLSREGQIQAVVDHVNERMSEWIREAPEQYLWLHKRFKRFLDYREALPWQP